jgi:transposase
VESPFQLYVGIDWAKDDYPVCVIRPDASIVSKLKVPHTGTATQDFVDNLTALSGNCPSSGAVAIEVPRGAIVEALLERNFAVFSINPKQMDRFRDRHSVGGAKDDPLDAFVAADSLRTDLKRFRPLQIDAPTTLRLRQLSRADDELRQDSNRVLNQVREQLHRYYAQILALSPSFDQEWVWTLWKMAPMPAQGAKLTSSRIEKLLKQHRVRKRTAADVQQKLRTPPLPVAPGVADAAAEHLAILMPRVWLLSDQRKQIQKRLAGLLEELTQPDPAQPCPSDDTQQMEPQTTEHRDARILLSLPGIGTTIGATMLAEAGQAIRDRDCHAVRSDGGCAPIPKQSGRKRSVTMRRSCNLRLRNALHQWAFVSITCDDRSHDHYRKLPASGHSHGRALRGIADRWLGVPMAMLRTGKIFDPARWQPVRPELNGNRLAGG